MMFLQPPPMHEREFGEFVIDTLTPDSVPMARLAEYVAALAEVLGKSDLLHFEKVEPGSLKIRYWAPKVEVDQVSERPESLAVGAADAASISAFNRMNDLLESDKAVGKLQFSAVVLEFPGRNRVHCPVYGPLEEETFIQGQLVRIGGKDKSIHAQINDGDQFHRCEMSRDLAMEMCHFLFGPTIRVSGVGRYLRDRDGHWKQLSFKATKFEELDDAPLTNTLMAARSVEGNGWLEFEDPLEELNRIQVGD